MHLLLCLATAAIVCGAFTGAQETSANKERRRRFRQELSRFRGSRKNKTDEELEYVRGKLKRRGERFKAKYNLTDEERSSLRERLQRIGRAQFKRENGTKIEEINVDAGISDYLYEGDIVLTQEQIDEFDRQSGEARKKRQAFRDSTYPATLWTGAIPYTLDSSLSTKARTMIAKGLAFWEANTCISFKQNGAGANSLRFFSGSGCYSYVGRISYMSAQEVSIGTGCESIRTVTHEVGHALGFFHAQSRHDRDDYVTINLANVQSGMEHNFRKEEANRNYNYEQPYEYGSVMHYSPFGFAIDSSVPTIVPKDSEFLYTMGSGREPSFYDVWMMNKHYNCLGVCNSYSTVCYNGGYKDIKNCAICKCPAGYGGNNCSQRKAGCGTTLAATTAYQTYTSAKVGDGTYTMQDDFAECNYWITAPVGKRIQVVITDVGHICADGCYYGGVEFKTTADQMLTGYRYCCTNHKGKTLTTVGNILPIVVFNRYYLSGFTINYRYIDGGATAATTTTKATTTTAKTTTKATTTSTKTTTKATTATTKTTTKATTATTKTTTKATTTTAKTTTKATTTSTKTTTKAASTTTKLTTTTTKVTTTTTVPAGVWTYFAQSGYYYKRLGTPYVNWTASEQKCKAESGHLVSIHSDAENQFVRSLFANSNHYFIGLSCSNKTCRWLDNTPLDYTKWWSSYPTASTQCTAMCPADLTWEDWGCTSAFPAICKRPAASQWIYYSATNAYYKVIAFPTATWTAAETRCKAEGGHLVSIHSATENQFVRSTFLTNDHHHIGLSCNNRVCTWIDGTPLDYTKWWSTNPTTSTKYVVMCPTDQTWEDHGSSANYPYICKKPGATTATTTTTIAPPTWTFNSATKSYYKAFMTTSTWNAAESTCISEGGHLVSIHSLAENQFVRSLFPKSDHYHIGANCNNKVCKWMDNTVWDYTKWWSAYPTNSTQCVVMCPSDQTWEDHGCAANYPFICKKPATAEWTYYPTTNAFYKEISAGTWNATEARCKAEGGHLASIHSAEENQFVRSMFSSSGDHHHIGLSCTNKVCNWVDSTTLDYKKWWSTNPTTSTKCVVMCPADQTWEDHGCTANYPAICKRTSNVGWTYYSNTNAWYKALGTPYTSWEATESKCQAEGGHLVSIQSEAENTFVRALFGTSNHYHIGLRCANKTCAWVDGKSLTYTKWWSSYPTATTQCVVMCPSDKTWEDHGCSATYPGICKRPN